MLKQRIITAGVLLALLLPTLLADSALPFLALTMLMIGAAAWEWTRLARGQGGRMAILSGLGVAGACALASRYLDHTDVLLPLWWLATALWVMGGALALRAGPTAWQQVPVGWRWALGLVLLILGWLALAKARVMGLNFLLSTLCIVWAADIAAYFGGRAFGRRKLAPSISPGKSWAGVYSGVAGVLCLAFAWLAADSHWAPTSDSVFTLIYDLGGPLGLAAAMVALAGLSVVGDLFESLVKRAAGVKDSSQLLPGHGGVLDRVDALLPVLPAALALANL